MKSFTGQLSMLMLLALVMSCQSNNLTKTQAANVSQQGIYLDKSFQGYQHVTIESEAEIFALTAEMKEMARSITIERDARKKAKKLLANFFDPNNINLAYKAGANVVAAQAFRNREANCLSLTILAYAIAKEADLDVAFQRVDVPEYWVRNGDVNMLTGHINLKVIEPKTAQTLLFFEPASIEIDFDPFVVKRSFPKQRISKNTVLAMFYNNKGANALINGDATTAYAYFKAATQVAPTFSSAWGNLGILYRSRGYLAEAMKSYRYAININPNNLTAMENLSLLLHKSGDFEAAKQLDAYIMRQRADNPYYYALLADEKYHHGDYQQAIRHFRKAIKLNQNIHEFYFGLAKVYYMLADHTKAEVYLKKALAKNRYAQQERQYLAKLNLLKKI
ncbi:Tfp pilus assembly protein PilF [Colwellia chukchiensis]|uniref:Tfp pilus assembly protein PilF n=1 Tax=Colwellia chukchiensis TaxID=641665 RepID=A0A1H7MTK7_9GAMM|nr:tetratricopeptide repeat protein [Colwellia chukchiensis]SEL14543.1 Tfp pilus assembly protein PilF [Colwellia chukchiensis]